MTILAGRIADERDRANQQAETTDRIAQFLKELFMVSDPSQARGETVTAREILDQGARKLDDTLKDQPSVQADLAQTLGEVYSSLGMFAEAERLTRQALTVRRQFGDDHALTVAALSELSRLALQQGRYAEAEQMAAQAAAANERLFGADAVETLTARFRLATAYTRLGRLEESLALFSAIAEAERRVLGDNHLTTLATLNNLAFVYDRLGRLDEAIALDEEVLARRTRFLGADHPEVATSMNNLAFRYEKAGRHDAAKQMLGRGLELARRVWGADHPNYAVVVHTLGEFEMAGGNSAAAEEHLSHALRVYRLQPAHQHLPLALYQLAQVTAEQGKTREALRFLSDALARGYKHGGDALGFADDPKLASLRESPEFSRLITTARAARSEPAIAPTAVR